MSLEVTWSNRLEILADALEASLTRDRCPAPTELLGRRECVVIPNRIQQTWLQQHFLLHAADRDRPRVMANCDFPLLHIFVNDCLHRMDAPTGARQAAAHPFSSTSLRWRVFAALQDPAVRQSPAFAAIRRYTASSGADNTQASAHRAFQLAARLADLFDEYTVYRPEMLYRWEQGQYDDLPDELRWQPELWQILTRGTLRDQTYLAAFRRMQTGLARPGLTSPYRRIRVFGPAMMPRVYLVFFDLLSAQVPVEFYLFNPSQTEWFSPPTASAALRLEGLPDNDELLEAPCRLLAELGRGCREFVTEVLDITGGQAEAGGRFQEPGADTLLHQLQSMVLNNTQTADPATPKEAGIQIHVCHSPLREVEVLRDHIWRWFAEFPELQPRDIQVQTADLALYSPYIEAIFTGDRQAPATIPYALADRTLAGESRIAATFQDLLGLADSRFTAPEVLALLRCQPLAQAFGFGEETLPALAEWITAAGIRWGRDAPHRRELTGLDFTDATSWRHGLDRLLLGFAMGRTPLPETDGLIMPADCVEGEDAGHLGQLAHFFDCLTEAANLCRAEAGVEAWAERLNQMVATFFAENDETYRETAMLREAISALLVQTAAAGFTGRIPLEIIRAGLAAQLQNFAGGDTLNDNTVIFSALRPGSSSPRRIMCLLGMGDGQFPRTDNRPAYDLMRQRHMGDRSPAIEDRTAWLEALMNARDVFYISYTGRSDVDNQPMPPSVLVQELRENVVRLRDAQAWQPTVHRLQAFHPDYFTGRREYFSYSAANCRAAAALLGATRSQPAAGEPDPTAVITPVIEFDELLLFLKNPAAWHYKNILGADLRPPTEAVLADSEEFAPGGLTAYTINQQVLAALMSDDRRAAAALPQRLAETGGLPLENWGRRWLAARLEEIRQLLATEVADLGLLKDILHRQTAPIYIPLEVRIAPEVIITGAGPSAPDGPTVEFRCARAKAADRLGAWLRHLLACATDRATHYYFIVGRQVDELEIMHFAPLDDGPARRLLQVYGTAFLAGHEHVPPFTPATAWAYAAAWHKTPRSGSAPPPAERRADALKAAAQAWYSTPGHAYGDDADPHYRRAFGPAGPLADEPDFSDWSARLMFPLFEEGSNHA